MKALSVVAIVCGGLALAGEGTASIPYERTESGAATVGNRPRKLKKTWILAERQIYWPGANVLHYWKDRPLFHDATLRQPKDGLNGLMRGYLRDVEILQDSGLDGFGCIAYHGVNTEMLSLLEKHPPQPGFLMMPVLCPSDGGVNLNEGVREAPGFKAVYDREKSYLLSFAKSPYAARVDGKVVFWTYGKNVKTLMAWAKALREDPEVPPFVMIGQMPFFDMYEAYGYVSATGALGKDGAKNIPTEKVEAFRRKVSEAARLMGGLQMWMTNIRNDWNGEYPTKTEATPIWRDYLLPVADEVLRRPENRDVLVGAYLEKGYLNNFEGWAKGNYGTAALRTQLDELLLINPDVLMCFEWNEENENTHFQPTVAHGKVWTRVLKYYRSLLDHEPPQPMKGDDVRVPNLVLSVRQALKIGEPYHLELLYLPDGSAEAWVTAQVTLRDENGKVLVSFPEETIPTSKLKAIDYRIASENLAGSLCVTPEVRVAYAGMNKLWKGFDSTRLSPTTCKNYLYSHHPLREMLVPNDERLEVAAVSARGEYKIEAALSCDEPLAALEVVDGVDEVAAADAVGWFDDAAYALFRAEISTVCPSLFGKTETERVRTVRVKFGNAPRGELRNSDYMWETASVGNRDKNGYPVRVRMSESSSRFFVRVPRTELSHSKMTVFVPELPSFSIDLETVMRLGICRQSLGKTVTFTLSRLDDLADTSAPLNARAASLRRTHMSASRFPVYQLRAVTQTGKVYRSAPVMPRRPADGACVLNVWSDMERKAVKARVRTDQVPVFDYAFDPACGDLLKSGWDNATDALLGGCSAYGQPMCVAEAMGKLPKALGGSTAPTWVQDGERWSLHFADGTYLCLPQEVIPRGAEYAVEFEIRPVSVKNQVLLRSSSTHTPDNGLQMTIKDGTVHLSFYGIAWYNPPDFDTKTSLRTGEWNVVRIVKRFEALECVVNGVKSVFDYDRRARAFSFHIFGSNLMPNETVGKGFSPFEGDLRALRISHLPPAIH